jgi:hypothetical protein
LLVLLSAILTYKVLTKSSERCFITMTYSNSIIEWE